MKNLLILLFFSFLVFDVFARPSPPKQSAEIFNDVYRDSLNTPAASLEVTLTATEFGIVQLPGDMLEGTKISFTATSVTDSAFVDLITLASATKNIQIINNSGGEFYLRLDSSTKGNIAPGQESIQAFSATAGGVVRIQSISGTVSTGTLYLNFFGD